MLIAQVTPAVLLVVTVAQGAMSNIEEPRQVVVRTAAEWQALWKEHSPETAVPAVDFAQSTVVGVFLGFRPTAGFSVEITAVRVEGPRTVVEYVEHRPPRDAFVAQIPHLSVSRRPDRAHGWTCRVQTRGSVARHEEHRDDQATKVTKVTKNTKATKAEAVRRAADGGLGWDAILKHEPAMTLRSVHASGSRPTRSRPAAQADAPNGPL